MKAQLKRIFRRVRKSVSGGIWPSAEFEGYIVVLDFLLFAIGDRSEQSGSVQFLSAEEKMLQ